MLIDAVCQIQITSGLESHPRQPPSSTPQPQLSAQPLTLDPGSDSVHTAFCKGLSLTSHTGQFQVSQVKQCWFQFSPEPSLTCIVQPGVTHFHGPVTRALQSSQVRQLCFETEPETPALVSPSFLCILSLCISMRTLG